MILAKKKHHLVTIISVVLLCSFAFITMHSNYITTSDDTYFHAQRIFEIRTAFRSFSLPSWVNFLTFHHSGVAINSMYPDITLWPLVLLTNWLSPIHQIISIRLIIAILTYFVTYFSIAKHFDEISATYIASLYTLSGSVFRNFYVTLQPGKALPLIVLFPVLFVGKNIIYSQKIDIKSATKLALLNTFVIYSHFMSIFVMQLILGITLFIRLIHTRNLYSLYNWGLSILFLIPTSLPVIFRYYTISSNGILPPFSFGNVSTTNFIDLFVQSSWDATASLSIISLVMLSLVAFNLDHEKLKLLLPYIYLEIIIIVLGTNLAPWSLLQKLPLFANVQMTNRFTFFAGAVPLIIFLINFTRKARISILRVIFCVAVFASASLFFSFYYNAQKNLVTVSSETKDYITTNTVNLTNSGINSDKITRNIVPDYLPAQVKTAPNSNGASLEKSTFNKILDNP